VLDQLIAGAGPEGIGYDRAVALLGVTDAALLDELCDALAAGDGGAAFATVDRVAEAGHDPRRFAADLLERLRDLIVLQQVPDAVAKGLLDAPADQLEKMSVHASQLGPATLSRCADLVHEGLVEMRGTASPRLLLELICARMMLPGVDQSGPGLLQRLERLERRLGAVDGPAPGPPPGSPGPDPAAAPAPAVPDAGASGMPAGPGAAAPVPAAAAATRSGRGPVAVLDAAAIRRVWDEVVATVGRRSKRAAAVVREASVREVDGDTIVLLFQHQVHANMLGTTPQPLLDAVRKVLGGTWQVRCEAREAREAVETPAAPAGPVEPAAGGAAEPDWPEPARPGGEAAAPAARSAAARSRPARPAQTGPGDPAGPGAARQVGGPATTAGPPGEPEPVDDVEDGPAGGPPAPGSGEQQALDLLRRSLGAEKIGEVAP
jgi:DNA polymerase-3 subunit gamma/tau